MIADSPYHSFTYCGFRFRYALRGDGIPVVFIQGVGVHGDGWLPQAQGLAPHCLSLTFDNRGTQPWNAVDERDAGKPISAHAAPAPLSRNPAFPFGAPITVEQMASDTLALMDCEGWPSAHLVGHSLGGLVAVQIALTARQRVRSLSLLCTFADGRTATRLTPRMLWLGMRSRCGPRAARRKAFLRIVMPAEYLRSVDASALAQSLEPVFGHDLADQPAIVNQQLAALKAYNATPCLAELAGMPTLIMSAGHDPISRAKEAGQILAQKIPGSRLEQFPEASHGLPLQLPERVNALLLEHIQSAQAARTPPLINPENQP